MSQGEELHQLEDWIPFAPNSVSARLEVLLDDPRLTPARRRAISQALEAAKKLPDQPRRGCAFPVIQTARGPSWFRGAVLHAIADWEQSALARTPLRSAFPQEERMATRLEQLAGSPGPRLYVTPALELDSQRWITLQGQSSGGACLLALEAERRGTVVPPDVVVSATVELAPDGEPLLGPVSGCEQKRRILEVERPGCRFFFVPHPHERVKPSGSIQLIRLEPGPARQFIEGLLGSPRRKPLESLGQWMVEAEGHYRNQRYAEAARLYQKVLSELRSSSPDAASASASWRITAHLRLGAVALHEGKTEEAERQFHEAEKCGHDHPEFDSYSGVELKVGLATGCIDRFDPDGARRLLVPLAREWERKLSRDSEGVERRMLLVSILGGLRRFHLLRGEPVQAVHVQQEVLHWSGRGQRARSLADLAECLRRAGRLREADEALSAARSALGEMLETYRLQTQGFIEYYAGRLALARGDSAIPEQELRSLERALPESSSARWRLRQLVGLSRLRAGEPGAVGELIREMETESSLLRRWHKCLGLLLGAKLAPRHAASLRAAAASGMREIRWNDYPLLERARRRFVKSVDVGKRNLRVEDTLQSHTPY